ncbi:hypothetical protein OAC88_01720 [Flavobacteriaceae bacterium]|nr:hypothetical protein [Flavobacteriaceae bacterium]
MRTTYGGNPYLAGWAAACMIAYYGGAAVHAVLDYFDRCGH